MYKVLLVFKDENISKKIKRMNIWGENSEFEISAVAKDGAAAYDEVRKQHYDLAVMQTDIDGMDGLRAWCFSAVSRILKTQDRV